MRRFPASTILSLLLLAGITTAGCGLFPPGKGFIPSNLTPEPIASAIDGLGIAEQVAHNWDSQAYLVRATSVYNVIGDRFDLNHSYYNFVSGDKAQYIGIVIDSSGNIEVNPPAKVKGSLVTTRPYFLEKNVIQEPEAMELAWVHLGRKIAIQCGPLENASIEGITFGSNSQRWAITYTGHASILGTVDVNSTTGEIEYEDINEYVCDLSD
jgi:hypothetical protein